MQKNLVIVESPAKAKTIEKFLGNDFKVMSSYGHIRDLKKRELSIDIDSLTPDYEIPLEKEKVVKELKQNARNAEKVWLASDEDREGEAISWHLCEVLGLDEKKTNRIVFHEITKPAILEAIQNPRHLDMNLVNAQQARRVLDRLVGFKLSPVLWRKVKPSLSAGRVQSVAVRLVVEREREIKAFKSEAFYRVYGTFAVTNEDALPCAEVQFAVGYGNGEAYAEEGAFGVGRHVVETFKDVRRALLDADVNYKVAKSFTDTVKQKALGMNVLTAVKPGQLMVKIVHDELAKLMGGEATELKLDGKPSIVLMSGLQGSGKTTFSGKLANMLKQKQHKHPLLVACDVYRPAAIDQLKVVGQGIDVPVYSEPDNKNVNEIADHAVQEAKAKGYDVVIIDTAGRLAVDEQMMNEISSLKEHIHPDEVLFVVDAMTGQDAVNTAKEFNDRLDFDGVVLTKLDGDTRGGAALSIRTVVTKPIKFIGTGEKMEAIDVFHPDRMADRILGMGDVVSLVERAQEQFDEEEAKRLQKKIQKNKFDFNDFLNQIEQIKKMGNLKELASMIPGVGKAIKDIDIDDNAFNGIEAIIRSMTPKERTNPEVLNQSRKMRIAKGSGTSIQEVNRLVKQFDQTRKMMKMVTGSGMRNMMRNMPKMQK